MRAYRVQMATSIAWDESEIVFRGDEERTRSEVIGTCREIIDDGGWNDGDVESCNELDAFRTYDCLPADVIEDITEEYNRRFVKNEDDAKSVRRQMFEQLKKEFGE